MSSTSPVLTSTRSRPDPAPARRVSRLRRRICIATVLVCLPYTLLKVAWLSGWPVGVADGGFTDTTRVANGVTAGLDVVAILLAIGFVAPWARRIPAFLVAFPVWIATGLLAPVMMGFLVGAPLQLLIDGSNPFLGDEVLAPWVFGIVYGGFVLQAALLLPAFVLYARDRWPTVTAGGTEGRGGRTDALQNVLGMVFIVAAVVFAVVQLGWATVGGGSFGEPDVPQRSLFAGSALAALGAAVAGVGLIRGGALTRTRLSLSWLGSGVIFTSTLNDTLRNVATAPGAWGSSSASAGDRTLLLFVLLGALGGAIGGAMRLVEEESATLPPQPREAGDHGQRAQPSRDDGGVGDGGGRRPRTDPQG